MNLSREIPIGINIDVVLGVGYWNCTEIPSNISVPLFVCKRQCVKDVSKKRASVGQTGLRLDSNSPSKPQYHYH